MTPIPDNIKAAIDALVYDEIRLYETPFDSYLIRDKNESRARLDALILEVVAERDRLRGQLAGMRAELHYIASANPAGWVSEMRDQFQLWAQNRARAALAAQEQPR